jgi:predicted MFS family arabinose efflux permease
MNRKTLAYTLIIVGVALALFSGLGDLIGVGAEESTFGWKQIVGIAVGAALLAAGLGMRVPRTANHHHESPSRPQSTV